MKKLLSIAVMACIILGCVCAFAENDGAAYVYGTMQIPYADFYAAEGVAAVDAVSSATNAKWKNPNLVAGTYNVPHTDDEGGDIEGVVFPVAIAQDDLTAMGADNYGFTALDEEPAAYKIVTYENGSAAFSAVQGSSSVLEAAAEITANTAWGDYQIGVSAINNNAGTSDIGVIYGVLVKTEDGSVYGMRHLENIWRDELAWSVGFTAAEPHGNVLSSENYADMMGKKISEITYITDTGYHVLSVDLYVPIKFDGSAAVSDAPCSAGTTEMTLVGLPENFVPAYEINNLTFDATDTEIAFTDALPGMYTLVVADQNGIYVELRTSFTLTTDINAVVFDAESNMLVAAEGVDTALAEAFIANLKTVTVNGTDYTASGRGAVAIICKDGSIDPEAAMVQGRGADAVTTPVFAESGNYELTAAAVGFDQPVTFTVEIQK